MGNSNDLTQPSAGIAGDEQGVLDFDADALPADVDAALRQTVDDMLSRGKCIPAAEGSKWGDAWEQLHYSTGMANPRARIGVNPAKRLNLVGAIARFVWMVGASDRLDDIAYYEPKVRAFTDNEISVPGSSYGRRIFEPAAGLNQIRGAVKRLQDDPASRQSAVVVWAPIDAVRSSADIPCAFGFFYHVRDGQLIAATIMRSNNAFVLLPYNFFEFSLLAEVVAASVGVPLGSYVHWAASMHVYERTRTPAERVLSSEPVPSLVMPEVPRVRIEDPAKAGEDPNYALEQVRRLAALEPRLRNASTTEEFLQVVAYSQDEHDDAERRMWLNDYWRAMFNVLVAWGAAKRGWWDIADEYMALLPNYLEGARFTIENMKPRPEADVPVASEDVESLLPLDLAEDLPVMGSGFRDVHDAVTEGSEISAFQAEVEAACSAWEARHSEKISLAEMQRLRETVRSAYDLAARSWKRDDGASAQDHNPLSDDAVTAAVHAFRSESVNDTPLRDRE